MHIRLFKLTVCIVCIDGVRQTLLVSLIKHALMFQQAEQLNDSIIYVV